MLATPRVHVAQFVKSAPHPALQQAVYVPAALAAAPPSEAEVRARIASARIREGLPVSGEILSRGLAEEPGSGSAGPGMFAAAERQDIYGDNERVAQARAVLAGAEDVLGGLQVCWRDGRWGVRAAFSPASTIATGGCSRK